MVGRTGAIMLLAFAVAAGCSLPVVTYGIRPLDPPALTRTVEIGSRQPTLKWESFPGVRHLGTDNGAHRSRITDVVYDLRIARSAETPPFETIYSRNGLPESHHRVEIPIEPDTEYLWTVRARFRFGGEPRVTEWGSTFPGAGRTSHAPGSFSYRFRTPSGDDRHEKTPQGNDP